MTDLRTFCVETAGRFGSDCRDHCLLSDNRAIITIEPGAILKITDFVFTSSGFRFIIATAVHTQKGFEIYYHFSFDPLGYILNLHVILPHDKPEIESLANKFSAANWIEREIHELFGIIFLNHPEPEALISDGNWAKGVYPYRKDAKELKQE